MRNILPETITFLKKKSHIYYKFIHNNAITHRPIIFFNSRYFLAVDSFSNIKKGWYYGIATGPK